MSYRIPFNKPGMTGDELRYMSDAIARGHAAGDGEYTRRCHTILQETLGVPRALLTTSCTHALEMSALLLDIKPGDEVILPSFTFVSTANAYALRGARPVFCDIRPDTLNLDEALLESLITPRTKAIVPVHYAGVACEMDDILRIAGTHNIAVVEDNAHGLFARYRGRYLGTFGQTATQSFHETKNVICGEGGALLLNDESLIERAEILREKGTNRSRYFRGQVDKYTWVDLGSSYLMSDILAAFLCAQLENVATIQSARRRIWETYNRELAAWAAAQGVRLPHIPAHCEQPYHMYYLMLPSLEARTALIQHLKQKSILSVFHYIPLHLSEMGRSFGGFAGQCPNTEHAGECLLRLPFYNNLSESEQAEVVEAILEFKCCQAVGQ
ncbi:MAG: dTDP-4-amino-4,6-dideoxygalactose transaminase [Candidatus Solibacter sp.]